MQDKLVYTGFGVVLFPFLNEPNQFGKYSARLYFGSEDEIRSVFDGKFEEMKKKYPDATCLDYVSYDNEKNGYYITVSVSANGRFIGIYDKNNDATKRKIFANSIVRIACHVKFYYFEQSNTCRMGIQPYQVQVKEFATTLKSDNGSCF